MTTMSSPDEKDLKIDPDKRERLRRILLEKMQNEKSYPLSFAQQRLWFMDRLSPGNHFYNTPTFLWLTGELSADTLRKATNSIVQRHAVLRTTFKMQSGAPVQLVHESFITPFRLATLDDYPVPARESEARAVAQAEIRKPFDLETDFPIRVLLLKISDTRNLLVLTLHHIVTDAWSQGIIFRDLIECYKIGGNYPTSNPAPNISYADYAQWQRAHLNSDFGRSQLEEIKSQLTGSTHLNIPCDFPRPSKQSFRGETLTHQISASTLKDIKNLAQNHGATLYMTLLSAFYILLHRYTGQLDLSVGTPSANRTSPELENVVGFFINTLVMRMEMNTEYSFVETLEQVKQISTKSFEQQDIPFEALVEELSLARDLTRNPLVQVIFAVQNVPTNFIQLPGLDIIPEMPELDISRFDFGLHAHEFSGSMWIKLTYNSDIFATESMTYFLLQWEKLLESIIHQPSAKISSFNILPNFQKKLVLEWGQGPPFENPCSYLFDFVEQIAKKYPNAIAAKQGNAVITYADLSFQSHKLAAHLHASGVRPGDIVGVSFQRSIEMLIAIQGTLLAGSAFLPLDPSYPSDRLQHMLDDSGVRHVLHQVGHKPNFLTEVLHGIAVSTTDELCDSPACMSFKAVTPNDLAYIIYTSGSTGLPKGVCIEHASAVNLAISQIELFAIKQSSTVLQFASLNFDAAISEIFTAWGAGACLQLIPEDGLRPDQSFIDFMSINKVSVATLPPSFLSAAPYGELPDLKTLVLAGEPCTARLVSTWGHNRRMLNAYGPTEGTVCASVALCNTLEKSPPNIGKPIHNVSLYVLDDNLQLCPPNVPGELYIGGKGVARGYLNSEEINVKRFLYDPFNPSENARMYKSGDQARWRSDGALEFLGRIDNQIKLRGYRIELGEIEHVLSCVDGVSQCAVIAKKRNVDATPVLVAYVCLNSPECSVESLKAHLALRLPAYMLPSHIQFIDSMPTTPNGKIDYTYLSESITVDSINAITGEMPSDKLELFLAEMWTEYLPTSKVFRDTHFFNAGGDSISAATFINRLQEKFGEYFYVVALFEAPILSEFADYLRLHYPEPLYRLGLASPHSADTNTEYSILISESDLNTFIKQNSALPPLTHLSIKNPTAAFILSPPRSGSTLLRAMLGANPALSAPPELELLSFNTMLDRANALSGKYAFWVEGLIRYWMELTGINADDAKAELESYEKSMLPVHEMYGILQQKCHGALLVDKTPSYSLDSSVLLRAEQYFQNAKYIHLLRHPCAMIRSFIDARLEQVFYRHPHSFTRRQLSELIWLHSQNNILEHLCVIPEERKLTLRFEELLVNPEQVLSKVCDFLEVPYNKEMLNPYQAGKMLDGIHPLAKMLGDVKFHQHNKVDSAIAERWKQQPPGPLSELTRTLARKMGYLDHSTRESALSLPAMRSNMIEGESTFPASFAQERMWLIDQLEPGNAAYVIPGAWKLQGSLNIDALRFSLTAMVARHASLRTTFGMDNGHIIQRVHPAFEVGLEFYDYSGKPNSELEGQHIIDNIAHTSFNLLTGPLFKVALLKLGNENFVFAYAFHHIISDGWSMGLFFRDISAIYAAQTRNSTQPLQPITFQYHDYSNWQREVNKSGSWENSLSYWKGVFADIQPMNLPLDKTRAVTQGTDGSYYVAVTKHGQKNKLETLAREEHTTLFIAQLTLFAIMLCRWTGDDEAILGTPVAGRNLKQLENIIGCFLNTIVLRIKVNPTRSFRELLRETHASVQNAYAHQDIPFEKLLEEISPERDLSRFPIFQVLFVGHNTPPGKLTLGDVIAEPFPITVNTSKMDLSVHVDVRAEELAFFIQFSTDIFLAKTIEKFGDDFCDFIDNVTASPDGALGRLGAEIFTSHLKPWDCICKPTSFIPLSNAENTIPDTFDKICSVHKERFAYISQYSKTSYFEIQQQSLYIAKQLKTKGVTRGERVALLLERGPWILSSMLGASRLGAPYVPLLCDTPEERLQNLLDDISPAIVITQQKFLESHLLLQNYTIFLIEELSDLLSPYPVWNESLPDDIAYILYTSGSTGKPKGVMQSQLNLLGHIREYINNLAISSEDVLSLVPPYIFDASVMDIYGALFSGAILLDTDPKSLNPSAMRQWLYENKVTVLHTTPTIFRNLFYLAEETHTFPATRLLVLGGEKATRADWEIWKTRFPEDGAMVNGLGPTESTLALQAVFKHDSILPNLTLPIGFPVNDMSIKVLDKHGFDNPYFGELVLISKNLALGYWRQDTQTDLVFTNVDGKPAYYTGDMVRILPDGQLIHAGRRDDQIKIHGHRIELAEVEHPFRKFLKDVVAIPQQLDGHPHLCLYYVQNSASPIQESALRSISERSLPHYMRPEYYIEVLELPMTQTGKVDRISLPMPKLQMLTLPTDTETTTDEIELYLINIWENILGKSGISTHDSFFDWGGNSLLAMQMLSHVENAFSYRIALKDFFPHPDIHHLAELIRNRNKGIELFFHKLNSTEKPMLSFAQTRLWFLQKLFPESSAYNVNFSLRFGGDLNVDAFVLAWNDLAQRHDVLRTVFREEYGQAYPALLESFNLPMHIADFQYGDAEFATHLSTLAAEPFSINDTLLYRIYLFQMPDKSHVMLLKLHHAITDAWSMGILIDELRKLYTHHSTQEFVNLPMLQYSYTDYANWQREVLQTDTLEKLRAYWADALNDMPPLDMPTDKPRPIHPDFSGANVTCLINDYTLQNLIAHSRSKNCTLYMALLSVFSIVLRNNSGQDDFGVGCPIANRPHPELKGMLGLFVNVLVLRCQLNGSESFNTLLQNMRSVTLGAYDHAELPFETLVDTLKQERDASRPALVQCMLTLHNTPKGGSDWHNVQAEWFPVETKTSRFDLSLHLSQTEHGLACRLEYSTAIFEEFTALTLLRKFELALDLYTKNPDLPIDSVPLITQDELKRVITNECGPHVSVPWEHLLEPFELYVKKIPEAIAVRTTNELLTYSELNKSANRLARWMQQNGVKQYDRVCISALRSPDRLIAVLAVIKLGAIYVPIDSETPENRCIELVNDAKPSLILADVSTCSFFSDNSIPVYVLGEAVIQAKILADGNIGTAIKSDSPIYIIYTSGSTGTPKGILNTNGAVINFLHWMQGYFGISSNDRIMHKTAFGFDVSIWEQFLPLISGAELCLLPTATQRNPQAILDTVEQMGVTMLHFGPAMLPHILAQSGVDTKLKTVKHLLTGGEPLSTALRNHCLEALSGTLYHLYGPTECTVDVSAHICLPDSSSSITPMGRPIQNTTFFVLDSAGSRVAHGTPGELFISGTPLAHSYWGAPEKTEATFKNLELDGTTVRAYKTGDIVRWLPNGELQFIGRRDQQIKLRGYRIELGEIQHAIETHPSVAQALVTLTTLPATGPTLLVHLITTQPPTKFNVSELKSFLRTLLPEYMVPAHIVPMEVFPLTPSGKVDTKNLPLPIADESELISMDEDLLQLAGIWSSILGVPVVDVHAHFFDLGGHSLLLVQLMARIQEHYGVEVPLERLFQNATLYGMAEQIRLAQSPNSIQPSPTKYSPIIAILREEGSHLPLFCIAPAGGTTHPYFALAHALGPDYPVFALQDIAFVSNEKPLPTIEAMAELYINAMREVQPIGPYHLAGWSFGGNVAFEMAQQLTASGEKVAYLGMIEAFPTIRGRLQKPRAVKGFRDRSTRFWRHLVSMIVVGVDGLAATVAPLLNKTGENQNKQSRLAQWANAVAWQALLKHSDMNTILAKEDRLALIKQPAARQFLVIAGANIQALNKYEMQTYPGDIVLYVGLNEKEKSLGVDFGATWKNYVEGQVTTHLLEGDHFSIVRPPAILDIAKDIQKKIPK